MEEKYWSHTFDNGVDAEHFITKILKMANEYGQVTVLAVKNSCGMENEINTVDDTIYGWTLEMLKDIRNEALGFNYRTCSVTHRVILPYPVNISGVELPKAKKKTRTREVKGVIGKGSVYERTTRALEEIAITLALIYDKAEEETKEDLSDWYRKHTMIFK